MSPKLSIAVTLDLLERVPSSSAVANMSAASVAFFASALFSFFTFVMTASPHHHPVPNILPGSPLCGRRNIPPIPHRRPRKGKFPLRILDTLNHSANLLLVTS